MCCAAPLQFIELPGQYSGLCKPQPELHVRVSSFDPKILVMGSLRRPKRLKIHGNDEKDYPYLVKGGEDLRLDQRVQQVRSRHQVLHARVC
jgi:DNA-dependent protein kinase catalytic subunit